MTYDQFLNFKANRVPRLVEETHLSGKNEGLLQMGAR